MHAKLASVNHHFAFSGASSSCCDHESSRSACKRATRPRSAQASVEPRLGHTMLKANRAPAAGLSPWQHGLALAERRINSQSLQDGVIASIFRTIGVGNRTFVEFGFNANSYGGPKDSGANTAHLYAQGWRGLLMDGGHENPAINLRREMLGPHGILSLLRKHDVPREVNEGRELE